MNGALMKIFTMILGTEKNEADGARLGNTDGQRGMVRNDPHSGEIGDLSKTFFR